MTLQTSERVIVVGAGPVGLTAAVVLARSGLSVVVLEAGPGLARLSRASTFHPSTMDLLARLGVADALRAFGRRVHTLQWRDGSGSQRAELGYALLRGRTQHPFRLHVEQTKLTPLLLAELEQSPNAEVRWNSTVRQVENLPAAVRLTVATHAGLYGLNGRYVIAADGAHSTVRDCLGVGFPGREYPSYALRILTETALDERLPGLSPMTYIRDAKQSCSLLGLPDHWRIIIRLPHDVRPEHALEKAKLAELVRTALPSSTGPIDIYDAHSYRTSRRVADSFRQGNTLLIGDAAHLTSTAGGMNMNCGLHDAFDIGMSIVADYHGDGSSDLIDQAVVRRRAAVVERIIPRSEARVAGVAEIDPVAMNASLQALADISADRNLSTEYLLEASMIDTMPDVPSVIHSLAEGLNA